MGLTSRISRRANSDTAAIERTQSDDAAIKRSQSDPVTIKDRADASEAQKGAMIDNKSMADYRKQFENHRLRNRHATDAEILHHVKEYIEKRINGIVDEACRKRIMDLTTVTLSVLSSMAIPFSGVAVVVAATVMQCLNFSVTLGLIPLLNVRSVNDLTTMSSQIGNTIKRASKSGLMAGVEASVLEILKNLGVGTWMWTEILRDVLIEMVGNGATDAAWIMTPLLAAPKYMLHRHLIKKMYRKLGDKAHVVHHTWTEQNCVATAAQTTVAYQAAVDEYGNMQGVYLQSQEVNGAGAQQVSQTNAYFQQQNGGAAQAQMSQTNAYFQPPNGAAGTQAQVSQTNAYFQQENGAAPQAQVSQTSAYFQQPNGQPQVTQTNAHFQQAPQYPQSSQSPYAAHQAAPGTVPGYGPQVPMQPISSSNPSSFQPQGTQIMEHTTNAYFQQQNGQAQVSQTDAYFQQVPQYPQSSQSPYAANQAAPGMAPGHPEVPMQPISSSNLSSLQPAAKPTATLSMGYAPQKNSEFFQPQVRPQGTQIMGHTAPANSSYWQPQGLGVYQASAAAQTYTPQPNPTYFQQPYGTQCIQYAQPQGQHQGNPGYVQMGDSYSKAQLVGTPQGRPQGNPYVQMGDFNKAQVGTPGQPQGNPYVQMGDYSKAQLVGIPQGQPQGNPYVQMGDFNKAQVGTPGQPQGNPYVQMGDYNKAQLGIPQGQPQGNPYVQMGDFNKAQVGTPGQPQFSSYGQAVQMQASMAYPQASAPPADLLYQQQAN